MEFTHQSPLSSLGHKFIVELQGPFLTDNERKAIERLKPIGFIPFAKNFLGHNESVTYSYERWLGAYSALVKEFKSLSGHSKIIVSLDHEGGRVIRPPLPITRFPYPAAWGNKTKEIANAMADELSSLGVNLSFSPVLDVNSNPSNPVIGERAFSDDPQEVAKKAQIVAEALTAKGILPCGKHFPGHGDTDTDSHLALPTLKFTLEELRKRELVPFKSMIEKKIPLIMTSHILFPAIDDELPATLSSKILRSVLREELGFKGVIISDALGMEAIRPRFNTPKTALTAITAGCDLFIVANNCGVEWAAIIAQNILDGLKNAPEFGLELSHSYERISQLLSTLQVHQIHAMPEETLSRHAELLREVNK